MSSTNEIGGAADARAAPKKWEFVNINKPKKHLDKEVISQVRAHATRNVRRKQRLELTAQYQKKVQATEPQSDHADSGVIAKRPVEIDMNDWLIGDKVDDDWSVALHVVLSRLGFMDVGLLASRDRVSCATEGDEDIQRHTSWRSCEEDKIWGSISRTFGTSLIGNPQSLVGGGVFDPFDALPVPGWSSYKSHVLKHFITVVALHCIPVDQRRGQNAVTKIWLPYALQDVTLFLATLTFAEVLLDIMSGNYRSEKSLLRKTDLIKAVNIKLRDREHVLSNETIGAVAMLAAMEGIVGNSEELRVHLNGLQKLVSMRGGLQNLGWGGILHTFISWQDLMSSTTTTSAPRSEPTPYGQLARDHLPHSDPIFGFSTHHCSDIASCFQNLRYLSEKVNSWTGSPPTAELMSFSEIRTDTAQRLLSLANTKPTSEMTALDYNVEACRLAALIYIRLALQKDHPLCATVRILKHRLMLLIKQGEAQCIIGIGSGQQPTSITWALFVSGITSINKEEQEWFAQRLAKGARASGVETWAQMEDCLKQICWLDKLITLACRNLWGRIQAINAEYEGA